MNTDYFLDSAKTGRLGIEKVLFSSHEPVFFTSRNEKNDLYLCLCAGVRNDIKKWLIAEVSAKTVIEVLQNKIYLRDALLKDNKKRFSVSLDKNGNYDIKTAKQAVDDWDYDNSEVLPVAETYMDSEEGEFNEEIEFYRERELDDMLTNWPDGALTPFYTNSISDFEDMIYSISIKSILVEKNISVDVDLIKPKENISFGYASSKNWKNIIECKEIDEPISATANAA